MGVRGPHFLLSYGSLLLLADPSFPWPICKLEALGQGQCPHSLRPLQLRVSPGTPFCSSLATHLPLPLHVALILTSVRLTDRCGCVSVCLRSGVSMGSVSLWASSPRLWMAAGQAGVPGPSVREAVV